MGKMIILDSSGHSELEWDPSSPDEVAIARREFSFLKRKGYFPFGHRKGEPDTIRQADFDPDLEEITWLKPLRGG